MKRVLKPKFALFWITLGAVAFAMTLGTLLLSSVLEGPTARGTEAAQKIWLVIGIPPEMLIDDNTRYNAGSGFSFFRGNPTCMMFLDKPDAVDWLLNTGKWNPQPAESMKVWFGCPHWWREGSKGSLGYLHYRSRSLDLYFTSDRRAAYLILEGG